MLPTLLLPLGGGILVYLTQGRRSQPRLVDMLATLPVTESANRLDSSKFLTTLEQNLALSCALLGVTTIGQWSIPFWRILSMGGLLYLDVYFIDNAFRQWQSERRITIATNDAIVATGLLLTGQYAADSLFTTLFFTSGKLQKQTEKNLASYLATRLQREVPDHACEGATIQPQAEITSLTALSSKAPWHGQIDQSALPLLTLGAISIPWLGIHRALAVLLTNFGYDYRLTTPLSTLHYLKTANNQGLWLRDLYVLDRLQEIDVLVLDVADEDRWLRILGDDCPYEVLSLRSLAGDPDGGKAEETRLAELRNEGHHLAWVYQQAVPPHQIRKGDLSIAIHDVASAIAQPDADVTLAYAQPIQLQQLLTLTQSLTASRKRGYYLALIPGLVNLGGIYLRRLDTIGALLIDYGATAAGIVNAMLPMSSAQTEPTEE